MPRLFVALDPGEAARQELARAASLGRPLAPSAKWVRPESMHLTLAFLGEVDAARIAELARALDEAALTSPPFSLGLGAAGTFGSPRRPRILFAGLSGDLETLGALKAAVAAALARVAPEAPEEARRYHPHLTLARARDPRGDAALTRAAERIGALAPEPFPVEHLALFESELSPSGPRYTPLHRPRLAGA